MRLRLRWLLLNVLRLLLGDLERLVARRWLDVKIVYVVVVDDVCDVRPSGSGIEVALSELMLLLLLLLLLLLMLLLLSCELTWRRSHKWSLADLSSSVSEITAINLCSKLLRGSRFSLELHLSWV